VRAAIGLLAVQLQRRVTAELKSDAFGVAEAIAAAVAPQGVDESADSQGGRELQQIVKGVAADNTLTRVIIVDANGILRADSEGSANLGVNYNTPGRPEIGLALSGIAVWQLELEQRGVAVLGALPRALPPATLALPSWSEVVSLLPLALVVALVCMMQTAAVIQSYSSGQSWRENAGREFAAVGAGSILAGLLGSFAVNSSPPRTAVAAESGGRSQLTGLLAVAIIAAFVTLAWVCAVA